MTEYEGDAELPAAVQTVTILIDRHAAVYCRELARYYDSVADGATRPDERPLLDSFNNHVERTVAGYDPAQIEQSGDSLVFDHIYDVARQVVIDDDELERTPIESLTALLAAEVEFRGPRKLSRTQSMLLAEIYERLGHSLVETDVPGHAALAFQRAQFLHQANEDLDAQDRCGLALARARRRARYPRWRRAPGWATDLLCGYGYRPFRLLIWIGIFVGLCALTLYSTSDVPLLRACYLCVINFLNPIVGEEDPIEITTIGKVVLVAEAYTGLVASSVFFALLVRRWFRL
ncbi:hypothetical protein [Nocardia sp. NPDC057353]|uniref:hypothetical protein n=1 Tax=Nocardia sp. NPDC057353 TaxID=3346104 RepID=UPI00363CB1DC